MGVASRYELQEDFWWRKGDMKMWNVESEVAVALRNEA
jgi:hypothetical protein